MANHRQAKKRIRQTARRTLVNVDRRSRMRGFVRAVEEAIKSGDKKAAETALRAAQPEMMRSAQSGMLHKSTVSRKLSRLSARIRVIGG